MSKVTLLKADQFCVASAASLLIIPRKDFMMRRDDNDRHNNRWENETRWNFEERIFSERTKVEDKSITGRSERGHNKIRKRDRRKFISLRTYGNPRTFSGWSTSLRFSSALFFLTFSRKEKRIPSYSWSESFAFRDPPFKALITTLFFYIRAYRISYISSRLWRLERELRIILCIFFIWFSVDFVGTVFFVSFLRWEILERDPNPIEEYVTCLFVQTKLVIRIERNITDKKISHRFSLKILRIRKIFFIDLFQS